MDIAKTKNVLMTFFCGILVLGIGIFYANPDSSGSLLGLAIGGASLTVNYLLLGALVKYLTEQKYFLTVQVYVLRLLIFIISILGVFKAGTGACISYGLAMIAISLAIFVIYGIGGIRANGQR